MMTRPLGAALGLEIGGIDLTRVTDLQMAEIVACFDRASALLVRGQSLSPEVLVAFSRRLGELDEAPVNEDFM
jgi:alpha-ketoglutarate-dependent taurine dioxygenase